MYTDRCYVVCTMRPPRRSLPSIIHLARIVPLTRVFSLLSCFPLDLLRLYPSIPPHRQNLGIAFIFVERSVSPYPPPLAAHPPGPRQFLLP